MQRSGKAWISASGERVSGLWHQKQRRLHPFRNTVVRMPGPSWMEKRWMLVTRPLMGGVCSGAGVAIGALSVICSLRSYGSARMRSTIGCRYSRDSDRK